jgi:photosystem II stability/assembly factor-like uncharacterized protein
MGWKVIVFASSDPKTIYAGSSAYYSAGAFDDRILAAGIYVSHDGGMTWTAANDGLSAQASIVDLDVDPSNPQIVYAATGSKGLLKTFDGGRNWQKMNRPESPKSPVISSVAVNPINSSIVYMGLGHKGLHRSEDGGTTWQLSIEGMPLETVISDIVFNPQNPQEMYASDHFSGVYRSDNGGQSWRQINASLRTRDVNRLAISGDGRHLYAATEGGGVYRLDFNGEPPQSVAVAGFPVEGE